MSKGWWGLLIIVLVAVFGFSFLSRDGRSKTPPAAPEKPVNLFTPVYKAYDELGYVPDAEKAIFLQPDDFGSRMVVVDYHQDEPHVHLYTHISSADAADARAALEKGQELKAILKGMKHFQCVEFVDWARDGFVEGSFRDEFRFCEGGVELGEKVAKPEGVLASEPLDPAYWDKLNGRYLAILREALTIYQGKMADIESARSKKTAERLSAAGKAIDDL